MYLGPAIASYDLVYETISTALYQLFIAPKGFYVVNLRRIAAIVGLVVVLSFALKGNAGAGIDGFPAGLVVADDRSLHHLNLYVAQELGLFKKHGIDVSLMEARDPVAARDLVLSGRADIFWACPTLAIMDIANGAPLKIIAQAKTPCNSVLVVAKSSAVRTIADLKGKRIAGLSANCEGVLAYQVKAQEKGGGFLVVVEAGGRSLIDLAAGKIDGAILEEPYLSMAERRGFRAVQRETASRFPCRTINARTSIIRENPEGVRRLLAAINEANSIIARDPASAKILAITERYTGFPEKAVKPGISQFTFSEKIDERRIDRLVEEMLAAGIIRENPRERLYSTELKGITWGRK
ncbi:MAG: ABC transporter substrate-binding protein [Geobacteraceae bacterium]